MSVDQNYINNIAPEFANLSNPQVTAMIGIAQTMINTCFWPASQLDAATGYLTAHLLKVGKLQGAITLASDKAGDLQESFFPSTISNELATTGYGLIFLNMCKSLLVSPFMASQTYPWFNARPFYSSPC